MEVELKFKYIIGFRIHFVLDGTVSALIYSQISLKSVNVFAKIVKLLPQLKY